MNTSKVQPECTNQLGALMSKKGMTEVDLSRATGLSQGHINIIKNTKRIPNLRTALRIARALKVPVEKIWSLNDQAAA